MVEVWLENQNFQIGDIVKFKKHDEHVKLYYEEGPFIVVGVQNVPEEYACGISLQDGWHKVFGCPYEQVLSMNEEYQTFGGNFTCESLLESAGHHQWVWVSPCNDPNIKKHMSGAWFMKV